MIDKIKEAASYIQTHGIIAPEIGIILGTGLGNLVSQVKVDITLDYGDIPYFPVSTVETHMGKLMYGELSGKKVLIMNGRFHYYEGYNMQEITFPVRVMKLLGIKYLLVSNAAGAINLNMQKASLMIIDDHINMLPGNPLVGKNLDEMGPRFLDMSRPYDPALIEIMEKIAKKNKLKVSKGVYVAWIGPSLETRAEYRFIKVMGADAVGMSTVPEVIVAHHMGIKVAAVSVITDLCDPDNIEPADINEIIANAGKAERDLVLLFKELVATL
ncbi:MAG: purine-nucleoside phosphorylase [Bacteroidales bacterium]|nr:purine-nucleoside phosphorylase [Bacteroidales bacterium]